MEQMQPPVEQAPAAQAAPKKNKLVITLIALGVTVAVLLGAFLVLKGDISKADYEKIEIGMTYEEVCDIIGAESECNADAGFGSFSSQVYTWKFIQYSYGFYHKT